MGLIILYFLGALSLSFLCSVWHVTELDWYDHSNHVVEMVIPENQSLIDL